MESSICTVCIISDFCWFVNSENLVYKLCITFWKCEDTQTLFVLECIFGKFNSNFPVRVLTLFLSGLKIVQAVFSPFLLVSKLYALSLWIIERILEMILEIYRKIDLYYLGLFKLFFWSVNCTILVSKLCLIFQN